MSIPVVVQKDTGLADRFMSSSDLYEALGPTETV
jgi:hypothetical protein